VRGAVVTVRDDVTVKATTATVGAPLANLCDRVGGAVKGAGYAVEQGAHGVPVQAGGVI
jgi:adenine/guanine phosphoribosyltransferase-like PRPP-binding protein